MHATPENFSAFSEPPGRHPPAPGSHSSQPFSRWLDVSPSELPRNLFCSRLGGNFGPAFAGRSEPSQFCLATPGPVCGPFAPFTRVRARGVTEVCTLPLPRSGRDRAPWQPTSFARLSRPSESLRCRKGLLVTLVWRLFWVPVRGLPVTSLSASRHPERWREPHYAAFDRYRRCSSTAY